jgi:peptidyl-prolyl cis-trans isomerase SurA
MGTDRNAWRALCALVASLLLAAGATAAEVRDLERIVAIVDEDVILASELLARAESVRRQIAAAGRQPPPDGVLVSQVLERLVVESVQRQMGERAGINIPDEMVTEAIDGIAEQNKLTLEQLRGQLRADGVPWAEFRDQVRTELLISRVQQARVGPRVQLSEQEVDNWMQSEVGKLVTADDYRVAHILLAVAADATPEARAAAERTARELYAQLQAGADFCDIAARHSGDSRALECGDLGWRKAAQLPSLFVERVLPLKAGELLEPFQSGSGWHLVKVVERRGAQADVEERRVRHVLVRPSEIRTDEQARLRAEEAYAKLEAGEDFCAIAARYSEDPGSALVCGELGWSTGRDYAPEFAAMAQQTPPGGRSKPFRTEFGWHVLEVEEQRSRDISDDNRRALATRFLRNQRFEEELELFLAEVREEAFVEIKL